MIRLRYISPVGDINKFKSWVNSLPDNIDRILQQSANNIMNDAKSNAPVLTGALRSGIVVTKIADGYMVYASVDYSRWQEEGTSRGIKGKKYMYSAMIKAGSNLSGQALEQLKYQ